MGWVLFCCIAGFRCCYCYYMNEARKQKPRAPSLDEHNVTDATPTSTDRHVVTNTTTNTEHSAADTPTNTEPGNNLDTTVAARH